MNKRLEAFIARLKLDKKDENELFNILESERKTQKFPMKGVEYNIATEQILESKFSSDTHEQSSVMNLKRLFYRIDLMATRFK